jgi:hypothetical protein
MPFDELVCTEQHCDLFSRMPWFNLSVNNQNIRTPVFIFFLFFLFLESVGELKHSMPERIVLVVQVLILKPWIRPSFIFPRKV